MSEFETESGTIITVDLEHKPLKGFWTPSTNSLPNSQPMLEAGVREMTIDVTEGCPRGIEIEVIVPLSLYREIEASQHFGVLEEQGSFSSKLTHKDNPIHLVLALDMSKLSPSQFEGLDVANMPYDLEEVVAATQLGWVGSPFRLIDNWRCVRVKKDPTFRAEG